jgi:hypothetical protein
LSHGQAAGEVDPNNGAVLVTREETALALERAAGDDGLIAAAGSGTRTD